MRVKERVGLMPSDLKEENRKKVLQAFRNGGKLTANDIAERTSISTQTVKKCLEYYISKNLLISCGKGSSSQVGGKRPELFSLNTNSYIICISLHHQNINIVLKNIELKRIATWNSGTVQLNGLDDLWLQVKKGLDELLDNAGKKKVVGVGLSTPLGTDKEHNLTVATPFPNWPKSDYGRSISQPLEAIFPNSKNFLVISDGRAAGYALVAENPEHLSQSILVTLYTSTGIGGAVIHNSDIEQNQYRIAGSFGHITVDTQEREYCPCGSSGCLEQMVNRVRMQRRFLQNKSEYKNSCLSTMPIESITLNQLFNGSAAGDAFCQSESKYYAEMFAIALRNIYLTIGPNLIVIQGDFGGADDMFKDELLKKLHSFKYISNNENVEIRFDCTDLVLRESMGLSALLLEDVLTNPSKYISCD